MEIINKLKKAFWNSIPFRYFRKKELIEYLDLSKEQIEKISERRFLKNNGKKTER